jgi:hypothetical protein
LRPLSARRYRIYQHEIPELIQGLLLRLEKLAEKRNDKEKAEIVFKALYRLMFVEIGRPRYPVFTWDNADELIETYKDKS